MRLPLLAPEGSGIPTTPRTAKLRELMDRNTFDARSSIDRLKSKHNVVHETILYDPSKPFLNLLRLQGTTVVMVLTKLEFWALFALHTVLVVYYLAFGGKDRDWPQLPLSTLTIPGAVLTFLIVFLSQTSFTRFIAQYDKLIEMENTVFSMVLSLDTHFQEHAFPRAYETKWLCYTRVTAAHFLAMATMPQYRATSIYEWVWEHLRETQVLTQEEAQMLKPLPGNESVRHLLRHFLQRLLYHVKHQPEQLHMMEYTVMENHVKAFVQQATVIESFYAQPVPWTYYHLLNMVVVVFLLFLAYGWVFQETYLTIVTFFFLMMCLLGLREVFISMADPFGTDATDLPVFDKLISAQQRNEDLLRNSVSKYLRVMDPTAPPRNTA